MLIQARRARIAAAGVTTLGALSLAGIAGAAAPDNDDFAAPEALSGRIPFVSGSNVDATKEQGEPDDAGEAGGASIELALNLAPPNDDFAAAVPLSGDAGSTGGTTEGATGEAGEPSPRAGPGAQPARRSRSF